MCFSIRKSQFLLTVVFGTDMIAETLALPTIKNIGKKNEKEITSLFESRGWTVIRIWECELKKKNYEYPLERIKKAIKQEHAL